MDSFDLSIDRYNPKHHFRLYLAKTALAVKKESFGQSPNNWLEPLKNWVLEAHSAKALAVSNNFTEVKLFVEKIGTNRRLFEKTVSWDWQKPFCLLAGAGQGERSEQGASSKNLQNTNWLAILHLARTFFQEGR